MERPFDPNPKVIVGMMAASGPHVTSLLELSFSRPILSKIFSPRLSFSREDVSFLPQYFFFFYSISVCEVIVTYSQTCRSTLFLVVCV
jgi:hypothetical protein